MASRYAPLLAAVATMALVPCAGRPNFLIYQSDDLDWMEHWAEKPHLPRDADPRLDYPTDNLDRLRTEGVVFTRAYASSPMRTPSRFSVLTGRYASRSEYGVDFTIACDDPEPVSSTIPDVSARSSRLDGIFDSANNLATALKLVDPDYRTGTFGKWQVSSYVHSEFLIGAYPKQQDKALSKGFDVAGAFYIGNLDTENDSTSFLDVYGYTHNLEYMVAEAMKFFEACLEADPPQPFFAYVNPTAPHKADSGKVIREALLTTWSLNTPEGILDEVPDAGTMETRPQAEGLLKTYGEDALGTVWVDDAFGALYNSLEIFGVLDETVVVFAMDHGLSAKATLFETGTRIAMFARYPPLFKPGLEVGALVSNIDILPTFVDIAAEAAGTTRPKLKVDGQSFKALASGNHSREERTLFLEFLKHRAAVTKTHKLIRLSTELCSCPASGTSACEHPRFSEVEQLYDLQLMYSQSHDEYAEQTNMVVVLTTMNAALDAHMASTRIGGSEVSTPTPPPQFAEEYYLNGKCM